MPVGFSHVLSMNDFLPGCLFAVVAVKCFMVGVNVWWVYLAPQNIPRAISVLSLGNKVILYWNCIEIVLILYWNCIDIVLKLYWNVKHLAKDIHNDMLPLNGKHYAKDIHNDVLQTNVKHFAEDIPNNAL